jgi:phosphoribosylformylglycinamidine (FGAM) synthase-like amidotransferase family enzyme
MKIKDFEAEAAEARKKEALQQYNDQLVSHMMGQVLAKTIPIQRVLDDGQIVVRYQVDDSGELTIEELRDYFINRLNSPPPLLK